MLHKGGRRAALVLFVALIGGTAQADGMIEPKRKVQVTRTRTVIQERPVAQIRLVPDCRPVTRRLLDCVPRRYISQFAPGVLEMVDGPPPRTRRPYPELFSWPR